MSESTDKFAAKWGAPVESVPVPAERFEKYAGVVPNALFDYWRTFGFAGFGDGIFWICDPDEWTAVVAPWTEGLDLTMGSDNWIPIIRGGFGQFLCWGPRTGMSLRVEPVFGMVFPTDKSAKMGSEVRKDIQVEVAFETTEADTLDIEGKSGGNLFATAVAAHGPLAASEVFAFVPAVGLGGTRDVAHLEKQDAVTHVQLLAELSPHRTMGDITKS